MKLDTNNYSDLTEKFNAAFNQEARNRAVMNLHTSEVLKGKFDLPAHSHINAYLMAVALKAPQSIRNETFDAFIDELKSQGREALTTDFWKAQVKNIVGKIVKHDLSDGPEDHNDNDGLHHRAA